MYSSCGTCEFCLAGMETICKSAEATGYSKPGGYAEYMVAPAAFVGRLPDDADPYALAPILCAGVTTYRGLKRTGARPGQWVTIVGIGGLGHIAIQYAKAMGLRVAAVDVSNDKLELAKSLGAEVRRQRCRDGRTRRHSGEDRRQPCRGRHRCRHQGLRAGDPDAAASAARWSTSVFPAASPTKSERPSPPSPTGNSPYADRMSERGRT